MKKLLNERLALTVLALLFSLSVLLHVLILTGIIPFAIAWGGRLKDRGQMVRFESMSIVINLVLLAVTAVRAGWIRLRVRPGILSVAFGLMALLFVLNTLGNLVSNSRFEQLVFTPVTAILALCCLRLALPPGKPAALPGRR